MPPATPPGGPSIPPSSTVPPVAVLPAPAVAVLPTPGTAFTSTSFAPAASGTTTPPAAGAPSATDSAERASTDALLLPPEVRSGTPFEVVGPAPSALASDRLPTEDEVVGAETAPIVTGFSGTGAATTSDVAFDFPARRSVIELGTPSSATTGLTPVESHTAVPFVPDYSVGGVKPALPVAVSASVTPAAAELAAPEETDTTWIWAAVVVGGVAGASWAARSYWAKRAIEPARTSYPLGLGFDPV